MKKKWLWGLLIVILLIVGGVAYYNGSLLRASVRQHQDKNAPTVGTPTFFFHGYGSSYHAEEYMVNGAIKEGILKKSDVLVAHVRPSGQVSLSGKWKKGTAHPVVEVNYDNPRVTNRRTDARWARNVIVSVQNRYRFKKVNLVGHSMGNQDISFYLLYYYRHDQKLPRLNKQVALAGPFNGLVMDDYNKNNDSVDKNGKPNHMSKQYKALLPLRDSYPRSAEVLNVYGNKGHGTDGDLTVQSAQSLRYLLNNRPKSYTEKEMHGKYASHSRLHHNDDVNALLYNFLWNHAV